MHVEADDHEQIKRLQRLIEDCKPDYIKAELGMPPSRDNLIAVASSGFWPPAVNPATIIREDDEAGRYIRASIILTDFVRLNPKQKLLDYGCGRGHLVYEAARRGSVAVGYDPHPQSWDQLNPGEHILTDDLDTVRKNAPYDTILLYDVLDHCEPGTQPETLRQLKSMLTPDGTIVAQCHPFSAVHGGHQYEHINLAYVHLVLNDDDLKSLGGDPELMPATKVVRPVVTYNSWFEQAGLVVRSRQIRRMEQHPILSDNALVQLMMDKWWKGDKFVYSVDVARDIMKVEHVNYRAS